MRNKHSFKNQITPARWLARTLLLRLASAACVDWSASWSASSQSHKMLSVIPSGKLTWRHTLNEEWLNIVQVIFHTRSADQISQQINMALNMLQPRPRQTRWPNVITYHVRKGTSITPTCAREKEIPICLSYNFWQSLFITFQTR